MNKAASLPEKFTSKPRGRSPWPAALVSVALVAGAVWWARSSTQAPDIGQSFANQGQQHIAVGAEHPPYNSFPATSGWHYAQPQPWGVFTYEIAEETLVHNLEHGGIVIQYNAALLKSGVRDLAAIQQSFPTKTIVAPNSKLRVPIAVTAWTRLYTLNAVDEAKIVAFVRRYKDRAPERFPD